MAYSSSEALEKVLDMKVSETTSEDAHMVQAIALVEIAEALIAIATTLEGMHMENLRGQ